MIKTLNENFANTWVLARELPELVEQAKWERTSIFARTLQTNYVYPVDIQVLSPEGAIIAHQPESKLSDSNQTSEYLRLLQYMGERDMC